MAPTPQWVSVLVRLPDAEISSDQKPQGRKKFIWLAATGHPGSQGRTRVAVYPRGSLSGPTSPELNISAYLLSPSEERRLGGFGITLEDTPLSVPVPLQKLNCGGGSL